MSYMEMELRNETGEASTKGICLNFGNFIDDLDFSSDMDYYQSEEYPIERYHAKMRELLEKTERRQQELPLLFSIPLEEEMTFLNCTFCYQFIVMDKSIFMRMQHEYELDEEALELCENEDMDFIVLYMGMNVYE